MIKVNKFFAPYILFLLIIGFKGKLTIAFITVFFHELSHYFTARTLGFSGFDIEILPIGALLNLKDLDEASPKEDFIISVSGPIFNLIMAIIFYFLYTYFKQDILYQFLVSNFALGCFNLIPAFPLDGGRVLRDILSRYYIYKIANLKTVKCSIIVGIILMFYCFYLFFRGIFNMNIGLIAIFIIMSSIKEKERITYLIMGDIIKKKCKFLKRGYIENKSISVHQNTYLVTMMSIVDRNKYNMFTILDDDMRVKAILYEDEIVDALKEFGNITAEELIQIEKI